MAKHSKVKNTGILFELLVRQITSDTLNNVSQPPAVAIIKEHFNKNTALRKELYLYQTILKEKYKSSNKADRFIDLVLVERSKIQATELRREKYNLIKEIKNKYPITEFFKATVNNYKQNAAIYSLFEQLGTTFKTPKSTMKSRQTLVEYITGNSMSKNPSRKVIEDYANQDKDLRLLAYKVLVDKFNEKYNGLSENQATVLREYINNISNTVHLRKMLQKVIKENLQLLSKEVGRIKDKVVRIKIKEVSRQLKDSISNKSKIDEKKILNVLRLSELVKEIKNARK